MMDGDAIFVDTNILVYASIPEFPLHSVAFRAIQTIEQASRNGWTSRQALREFWVTLTRPQAFGDPIPIKLAIEQVRQFERRVQIAEDIVSRRRW